MRSSQRFSSLPGYTLPMPRHAFTRIKICTDRLRYAREHRSLTRDALAHLIGVSVKTVQRFESGEVSPTPMVLDKLALHLGVKPEYLQGIGDAALHDEDPGPPENPKDVGRMAESVSRFGKELGETTQKAAAGAAAGLAAMGSSDLLSPRLMDFLAAVKGPQANARLSPMELAEQILAMDEEEFQAVMLIVRAQRSRAGLPWPGGK